jgi:hypothetical protein
MEWLAIFYYAFYGILILGGACVLYFIGLCIYIVIVGYDHHSGL